MAQPFVARSPADSTVEPLPPGDASTTLLQCRRELLDIQNQYGTDLDFMHTEFNRLEQELCPTAGNDQTSAARHERLVHFIRHLRETTDKMASIESALSSETSATADVIRWGIILNEVREMKSHIQTSLLPIKARLEAQLYGAAPPAHSAAPMHPGPHPGPGPAPGPTPTLGGVGLGIPHSTGGAGSFQPSMHWQAPTLPMSSTSGARDVPTTTDTAQGTFGSELGGSLSASTDSLIADSPSLNGLVEMDRVPSELNLAFDHSTADTLPSSASMHEMMAAFEDDSGDSVSLDRLSSFDSSGGLKRGYDSTLNGDASHNSVIPPFTSMGGAGRPGVRDGTAAGATNGHSGTAGAGHGMNGSGSGAGAGGGQGASRKRQRANGSSTGNQASSQLSPVPPSKPKQVEYQCSACNETYPTTCELNPWWALIRQECPKCHKQQIPRIDISEPANAIEYHPALLRSAAGNSVPDEEADQANESGGDSAEESEGDEDLDPSEMMPPSQASRLLVLITHARTCPGHHRSPRHAEVCKSVKYLMLHIRDCCGKNQDGAECAFPWCKPCKYLLSHLVKCHKPDKCPICSPIDLPPALRKLKALNQLRDQVVSTIG